MSDNIKTLTELISSYGSDKAHNNYAATYELLFEPLRFNVIDFLEIGIGTLNPEADSNMALPPWGGPNYTPGASLRAFKEYFPNGNIYGVDNQDDCLFTEPRITTFKCDSRNREKCDEVLTTLQFDVILDDGSHSPISQTKTFRNLWHRVKNNGIYIIEDIDLYNPLYDYYDKIFMDITEDIARINVINNKEKCRFIVFKKN
jgi:hypothetical protein